MNLEDAKCKGQENIHWLDVRSESGMAGDGCERRAGLGWTGDLKVITAGMSQVRPHFDE